MLGADGSRCHYAIEPHGVTEEEVEATRQELSKTNAFALPSRQATWAEPSSAVPSLAPADGAAYAAASAVSYATARPQQSGQPNQVVLPLLSNSTGQCQKHRIVAMIAMILVPWGVRQA